MALKSMVKFLGVDVDDAYIYVSEFRGNKTSLTAQVSFCASSDKSQSFQVKEYNVSYSLDAENPLHQIYMALKALPEFTESKDC